VKLSNAYRFWGANHHREPGGAVKGPLPGLFKEEGCGSPYGSPVLNWPG
jgi:hypothetical protein